MRLAPEPTTHDARQGGMSSLLAFTPFHLLNLSMLSLPIPAQKEIGWRRDCPINEGH